MLRLSVVAFVFALLAALPGRAAEAPASPNPDDLIYLDVGNAKTTYGRVVIRTRPDLAPNHVARFKELARRKFYDGVVFHRVIPNFMAQTGDPKGTGEGGSDLPDLKAEFSATPHYRGIVSTARMGHDVDTANSQFFIMLGDKPELNGHYTVWGEVVSGMQYVDMIKQGDERKRDGLVDNPDRIIRMRVGSDVKD